MVAFVSTGALVRGSVSLRDNFDAVAIYLCAGPVTILNWSFPRKDISRSAQAYQLALALRDEVADLEAAGCKVIQVSIRPLIIKPSSTHRDICFTPVGYRRHT